MKNEKKSNGQIMKKKKKETSSFVITFPFRKITPINNQQQHNQQHSFIIFENITKSVQAL
jgi:hypothetical protein